MAKKPNIIFIIEEFWNRGYILYDNKYKCAKEKMKYSCMRHPREELEITWSDFKSGKGCKHCRNDNLRIARQKNIKEVTEMFDLKGLVLVSDVYINNKTSLEFYCKEHDDEIQNATFYCVSKSEISVCRFCIGDFHSERLRGDKSPLWKGGIRTEIQALRETLDYKRWRESVFKRDNYTCNKCFKSKSGSLQAHHILPFSTHEELRHDIGNGITLCRDCHDSRIKGSFHNIYGTHNNTKEQLEEFLKRKL